MEKRKNPWNKVNGQPKASTKKSPIKSSEQKFKEAQRQQLASVQKHTKYESSSDEEDELELNNVINLALKQYAQTAGSNGEIGRTQTYLENALSSGVATCLICLSSVKRDDGIWSCKTCYDFFHLMCIQRWSKDTVTQKKQALEGQILVTQRKISWDCPKCRHEYSPEDVPKNYVCFCGKLENPKFQPLLIPHSCGEICKKDLEPKCGHKCLLLCHPGPCPPCPVTVSVSCYCEKQPARTQRCSNKNWSCGEPCKKLLLCSKHYCANPCHSGDCEPCPKKSIQKCVCGAKQQLRDCANPTWQCDKVCNKPLECGNHKCQEVCHYGVCDVCDLVKPRTCPCGKTKYQLPCTQETPTCKDTCDKLLECGQHTCNQRCHREKCGTCLENVVKSCRCGQHTKEVQCSKPFLCETKCKNMKDCLRHPCNKKCCDGNCPPCEKPCGKTLSCGNHKCQSICHRGPCYPCNQTKDVFCRCKATKITVPCGRKNKTKPPKCPKLCTIPPNCHHEKREKHRCHFGDCPSCKQICLKVIVTCGHACKSMCHSAKVVVEEIKASMPWEQKNKNKITVEEPCPPCQEPLTVKCLGEHEEVITPCCQAIPRNCGRSCGRLLICGNHFCTMACHKVGLAPDNTKAGEFCEDCEGACTKERPEGCSHQCPKPCHPGPCPPCKQMVRIKCHCGLNQPYVVCSEWIQEDKKNALQCCGNQCPKNYECGHRCKADCHPGPCPNAELCKKKMKIACPCKRIKKEFSCQTIRQGNAVVECDATCEQRKIEEKQLKEAANEQKKKEEEIKNQKELEKYQKFLEGKKKSKERRIREVEDEKTLFQEYFYYFVAGILLIVAFILYFFLV